MGTPEISKGINLAELSQEESSRLLLKRLQRLVALKKTHEAELNPRGVRLLTRQIFETYGLCQTLGLEDQALKILYSQEPSDQTLGSVIIQSASEKSL